MSGILDSRQRVMDTIVTLEGRRQIASGKLKVEYVSFTDATTFYTADAVSGSSDVTTRLYFENASLPQDQITFEADDSGRLKPFKNQNNVQLYGGKIVTVTSSSITGSSTKQLNVLVGDEFSTTSQALIAGSIENFKNLYTIATNDPLFLEDENFAASPNTVEFSLTAQGPIDKLWNYQKVLGDMPSLFSDKHLSNVINFKYLPPINKLDDTSIDKTNVDQLAEYEIGDYVRLGEYDEYTIDELEQDLEDIEEAGYKKTVIFEPTTFKNSLVTQIFETSQSELKKLDVIDYGRYKFNGVIKNVFFVGKLFVDDYGANTFVKLFTIVFE